MGQNYVIYLVLTVFYCLIANEALREVFAEYKTNAVRMVLTNLIFIVEVFGFVTTKSLFWFFPAAALVGLSILLLNYNASVTGGIWNIIKLFVMAMALYLIIVMIIGPDRHKMELFAIYVGLQYMVLKVYKILRKNYYNENMLLLVILPIMFLAMILYIIFNVDITNYQRVLILLCVVAVDALVIIYYQDFVRQYQGRIEQRGLEERKLAYENQIKLMVEKDEALRRVRHDMKNHLLVMRHMLDKNALEEIGAYLDALGNDSLLAAEELDTGNFEMDAILNSKAEEMKRLNIAFDKEISVPIKMGVEGVDIAVIVGNLLDNAICAVKSVKRTERKISFVAKYQQGMLFLLVSNPYVGKVLTDDSGYPVTTKKEPKQHGIGLGNVRKTVHKYKGNVSINTDNKIFTVKLDLYCKEEFDDAGQLDSEKG